MYSKDQHALRIEKNFSHKESSLILVYETIAEIFYYLERFLVPFTTNDNHISPFNKSEFLDKVSTEFSNLRLISLKKEMYIPTSAELGKTMANLMGYINRIQNNPDDWKGNTEILNNEFRKELKILQDRIKEQLELN